MNNIKTYILRDKKISSLDDHIQEKLLINKNTKINFYPNTIDEFDEYIKNRKKNNAGETKENPLDLSHICFKNMPETASLDYYFDDNLEKNIKYVDASYWSFSDNVEQKIHHMFSYNRNLEYIDVTGWDISNKISISCIFEDDENLKEIIGLETWNTSNIHRFSGLFRNCKKLQKLDLSSWDTSSAITIRRMFEDCLSLKDIGDISNWNTENVTNMCYMFKNCHLLQNDKLNGIENWNVSNVTNIYDMFFGCRNLSINLNNWNVSGGCGMMDAFLHTKITANWYKN